MSEPVFILELSDEMVEAAVKAMAKVEAKWESPYYGMDMLARAALEAALMLGVPATPKVRQFAFDIVMRELGMDESDMDDQEYASEQVDKWMEHWAKMSESKP